MAGADLDKQPDSVSSVLKVFGILQALGEEREIGITELSQRVMMSKAPFIALQTMKSLGYVAQEGESEKYSLTLKLFELARARCRTSTGAQRRYSDARTFATDERDHPSWGAG